MRDSTASIPVGQADADAPTTYPLDETPKSPDELGHVGIGCKVVFDYMGIRGTGIILDRAISDHGRAAVAPIRHRGKKTWIPRDCIRGTEPTPWHLRAHSGFQIGNSVQFNYDGRLLHGQITWINPRQPDGDMSVIIDVEVANRQRPSRVMTWLSNLSHASAIEAMIRPKPCAEEIRIISLESQKHEQARKR